MWVVFWGGAQEVIATERYLDFLSKGMIKPRFVMLNKFGYSADRNILREHNSK